MKFINLHSKCKACGKSLRPTSECVCPGGPTIQVVFNGPVGSKTEQTMFVVTKRNGAQDTVTVHPNNQNKK